MAASRGCLEAAILLVAAAQLAAAAIAGELHLRVPCMRRCIGARSGCWKARIVARLSVHGGDGRSAHCPKLDGSVAYVDGSVNSAGRMGVGAFFGAGHAKNLSVRVQRPAEPSRCPKRFCRCQWRRQQQQQQQQTLASQENGDPNVAELAAVLLVLLQHPRHEKLAICTDSAFTLRHLRHLLTAEGAHCATSSNSSGRGKAGGHLSEPRGWTDSRFLP